ncbi:MAG TPA: type II toxin-antitoxin system PemK/MazF family toxin [Gemmatimonadaceae bacterium]|jgi:mRNA interferase MazF|nr:type II toxin-antitoxin system PemK/MazF family toxin [Gemmatimonadaceae bacterium]
MPAPKDGDADLQRGSVWWIELGESIGSEPGFRRPGVVVQADAFNRSRIETTVVALLTSNLALADAPGNVIVRARESGLPKDSVINVSQLYTIDKSMLLEECGHLGARVMRSVDAGLRLVLELIV